MIYRRFGRTNLQMPVFSCGGMRYQYKWQDQPLASIPDDNQKNLEATIRRSIDLGINHIETARGYGSSERQLGAILPSFPREKLIVQTKIAPDKSPCRFYRHFKESLRRLRLSHVDLLSIHGINDEETAEIALNGCLAAARKLQARGYAKHIGFSTHAPADLILQLLKHQRDGGFDYVNLHWYYIFQKNWPAIQEAQRRDIGVFIISPSDKGGLLYKPPQKLSDLTAPLPPIVFNDLFCLSHPQVHTLSIGAARPTDFDAHLATLPLLEKSAEILPPILARLDAATASALPPELRTPLTLNLPHWQNTPGKINLPVILWLRTLATAYDLLDYARMRYNLLGNGGHWFPGENAATADTHDLSAIEKAAGLTNLKHLLRETHALLWKEPVKRLSQS